MTVDLRRSLLGLSLVLSLLTAPVLAQNPTIPTPISLNAAGTAYVENFNTLANTSAESTVLPTGWAIWETGTSTTTVDGAYVGGTGSGNTGDTYSFGATSSTERAFGYLDSGTNTPRIGAVFTNNTGVTVTSLAISYKGEQWRRGNNTAGLADRMDFQISFNATAINDAAATWTDVNQLDFSSKNTGTTVGALDGNAESQPISHTITSLNIAPGATFWIRWVPIDIAGSEDGLAVDDFSLTPNGGGPTVPTLTISNVSQSEGNAGTTSFVFQVNLSSPAGAGGVSFTVNTADGSATTADNDYQAIVGQPGSIPAGQSMTTVTVLVNGDVTDEPNETFTVNLTGITGTTNATASATGTIQNDDAVGGCTVTHTISQIQGSGEKSPLANGTVVTTSGIVTGVRSNAFFMQDPVGDGNPNTSDGIFVFTSSAPSSAVVVGNSVCVTGPVLEFKRSADDDPTPFSLTEIDRPTAVTLLSSGNPLPAPVGLTSTNLSNTGKLDQLEQFEGMIVGLPSAVTVAATEGFGDTFLTLPDAARPFREKGVIVYEVPTLPGGFTACPQNSQTNPNQTGCIPVWDGNPELIMVDSDFLSGTTTRNYGVGAALSNVTGPLHYDFGTYRIATQSTLPTIAPQAPVPVPAPASDQLTVASFNVERFYDTIDDPGGDTVVTPTAYETKRAKLALMVKDILKNPDVIGFQEVEKLAILTDLGNTVNTLNGGSTNYVAYLVEGNDPGGIDVGYLVNANRVQVNSVQQFGKTDTYVCGTGDSNGNMPLIHDRPPLMLKGTAKASANAVPLPFTVIVNHFRSLLSLNSTAPSGTCGGQTDGFRVRLKRAKQAEAVAQLAQAAQTGGDNLILVGDYNAFEFNDGYVDVIGGVSGAPAAVTEAVTQVADLVNPNLVNQVLSLPQPERYTYSFNGSRQVLDHILISTNLNSRNPVLVVAHANAEQPEFLRSDATIPQRSSDHDPPVVLLRLPTAVQQNVTIERLSLSWNILQKRWVGSVRVTNTTGATIAAPISLCLTGLDTAQFSLQGGTNTLVGPCRSITGTLAAAAQTTVTIQIEGPQTQNGIPTARPVFVEKLYSGAF
jgi:predicted extracellular nuclease